MRILSIITALLLSTAAIAQNPYLPLWEFIPDGEPYVFEDPDAPGKQRVYVYGSHDMIQNNYCGRDQVVWSAAVDDLKHWRYDGVIFESKRDANGALLHEDGRGDVLFAPDVTVTTDANGKKTYWLYPNNQDRNGQVCRADRPDGPFTVANWKMNDPRHPDGILGFDPAVFVDDDGRVYGYWGFKESNGAELDPKTMATVKPGSRIVKNMIPAYEQDDEFRFFEASSMRKIKDKYVFIYSRWTKDGDFGMPESNYTLAYCWANSPLGPFKYGGTIIDGRAGAPLKSPQGETRVMPTATPNGNTHGSICEINGKWWVFYHRQAGDDEYSRQAMVAPIEVEVREGVDGYVRISQGEYTSEGFATEGLDPYETYPAGIACYYTGPTPAYAQYPKVIYSGSHTEVYRINPQPSDEVKAGGKVDPYDLKLNRCAMVNNTDGSVVGYKYYNMDRTYGAKKLQLVLGIVPEGIEGDVEVWFDAPKSAEGTCVGTAHITAKRAGKPSQLTIAINDAAQLQGKHALYLVFLKASEPAKSICRIETITFK